MKKNKEMQVVWINPNLFPPKEAINNILHSIQTINESIVKEKKRLGYL